MYFPSKFTDSAILILEYSETDAAPNIFDNDEETIATENWTQTGTLRGHLQGKLKINHNNYIYFSSNINCLFL